MINCDAYNICWEESYWVVDVTRGLFDTFYCIDWFINWFFSTSDGGEKYETSGIS